ncbi:hypothetical protein TIFTF001_019368 [Ficus carica]|uniref:Uncharacterized protein n=1 Tax=Ficus carica TaxID=3494 RepID=A0AA88A8W9_FICCA|nr:hypothetical protein TIFTF001_019368 [Ficus carica]
MQKKSAKKVTTESNNSSVKVMAEISKAADTTSKRACICAPTNHAGSFRCHLHRAKIMSCNTAPDIRERSGESFSSKIVRTNGDGQPRLSRFGRAACENPPLTRTSSKLEKVK